MTTTCPSIASEPSTATATPATREVLAARATYGIWKLLTTDDGARKDFGRERYHECRELKKALELEQRRLNQQFDEIGQAVRRRRIDASVAAIEMLELQNQIREVGEHRQQCERELHSLRYDRNTWIAVPDDVVYIPPFEFDLDDDNQTAARPRLSACATGSRWPSLRPSPDAVPRPSRDGSRGNPPRPAGAPPVGSRRHPGRRLARI